MYLESAEDNTVGRQRGKRNAGAPGEEQRPPPPSETASTTRLSSDGWIQVGIGIVSVAALVVGFLAYSVATESLDQQKLVEVRIHSASLAAIYDAAADVLALRATEPDKSLVAVRMVLPSALGVTPIWFDAPEVAASVASIRDCIERLKRSDAAQLPERGRYSIPIGCIVMSTHQGATYGALDLYAMAIDYEWFAGSAALRIETVSLANLGPIEAPAFPVFKLPWNSLSRPDLDAAIQGRRIQDAQAVVDEYWSAVAQR